MITNLKLNKRIEVVPAEVFRKATQHNNNKRATKMQIEATTLPKIFRCEN
jgi:hypothetical protein